MGMFEEFEVPKIRPHIVVELKANLILWCRIQVYFVVYVNQDNILCLYHMTLKKCMHKDLKYLYCHVTYCTGPI